MPRVLLTGFCAVPGPRRAGVQLRHVIRSLTGMHTVDLLVVREGEQAYVERQGSVRVLRVPTQEVDLGSQIQAFQRALKRQLDGADYDVVHCRDSWSGLPVLEARSRLGYAVVYDLTRSPLGEPTFDPALDAQYARDEETCLAAADLVLAPTPAAVRALQGRGRPDRVILAPPGVDVDRFDWEDVAPTSSPRILYVGSIDPGRGLRVLVRAMAAIVREVDARLVLAGSIAPKFEHALHDGIRELGLADKVDVLGAVDHDQLPALLATATVCVVPAAADLTPNPTLVYPTKLLEYMACRCAIVAPRRETVMQIVEDNRDALLFEPGDPIDLAHKVMRMLGEPALRERLAQHAYDRVRRDFTASAARRALRGAYNTLADRFSDQLSDQLSEDDAPDESPKVEVLSDDDFEATVFEEAPSAPAVDTVSKLHALDDRLGDDAGGGPESVVAPPPPMERDETMERAPVTPPSRDSGAWTVSALIMPPAPSPGQDDWVITHVGAVVRGPHRDRDDRERGELSGGEDGTQIEEVVAAAPALPVTESAFVAGEIDVPSPGPEPVAQPGIELTAASSRLAKAPSVDAEPGPGTPPSERR